MQIDYIIKNLSKISYIPVTLIDHGTEIFHYPDIDFLPILAQNAPSDLLNSEKKADCILTDDLLCYGITRVKGTEQLAIWGPVSVKNFDNQIAQKILRKYDLPTSKVGELLSYFNNVLNCSLARLAYFIKFGYEIMNNEPLDDLQLLPEEYYMNDDHIDQSNPLTGITTIHDGQELEKRLFSMITFGNVSQMNEFIKSGKTAYNEGSLANDMMRHQKNLTICSVTIAARAAVAGGFDYETAMSYADGYIQKIEATPNIKVLAALHNNMLKTYTKLVAERKLGNPEAAISSKVYSYVEKNINKKLSTVDVAKYLDMNASYIGTQFKKETGISISDYINQAKINEAKRMLLTTEMSIVEIANYLDFSSQSYFHVIFKKIAGTTPKEYKSNEKY